MTTVLLVLFGALALIVFALVAVTAILARHVERSIPPEGTFVDVDGNRIHYIEAGQGPTLLLIHGLGGNARNFTYALTERLTTDYRVIVMERPGSGYSTRPDGAPAGPLAQAHVVAAFIRKLQLEPVVIVGHSLGGAIALATAVEYPEVVRALALISPVTVMMTDPPALFHGLMVERPFMRTVIGWTLATPLSMLKRAETLDALFGPEPVLKDFGIAGGGFLGLRPSGFVSASTDLVAVPGDFPAVVSRYKELRMPVGILYGTGDRILDHRMHGIAMTKRVPGIRVELIEGGHMIPLTQPDAVATFVRSMATTESAATR